jgi:predicted transcriptional regulator
MQAKQRKAKTKLMNFRLSPASTGKLTEIAATMRRSKTSIMEQLVEKYCAVEHLQP